MVVYFYCLFLSEIIGGIRGGEGWLLDPGGSSCNCLPEKWNPGEFCNTKRRRCNIVNGVVKEFLLKNKHKEMLSAMFENISTKTFDFF